MSDELSQPIATAAEDTVTISGSPKATEAQQRERMPHSFEFAYAVIGDRPLARWLVPIAGFVGRRFLIVTAGLWGVLVVSALFGWLWPAVVVYALAAVVDYLASRELRRDTLLLRRLGTAGHVRHFIRGVLLLAVLARDGQQTPAGAWAGVLL